MTMFLLGIVAGMTLLPIVALGLVIGAMVLAGACAVEMDRRADR